MNSHFRVASRVLTSQFSGSVAFLSRFPYFAIGENGGLPIVTVRDHYVIRLVVVHAAVKSDLGFIAGVEYLHFIVPGFWRQAPESRNPVITVMVNLDFS